jgi:hypothetical protein
MEENIIKISMGEYYCTVLRREPVEINIGDYPVLLDMTIEDAKQHILENYWDMEDVNGNLLADLLRDQDILWDKIKN